LLSTATDMSRAWAIAAPRKSVRVSPVADQGWG